MKIFFITQFALMLLTLNGDLVSMEQMFAKPESTDSEISMETRSNSPEMSRSNSQEMFDCTNNKDRFEFISFNSNIGDSIAEYFDKPLHCAKITEFADGETEVTFDNPNFWQNKHALIIHTTYPFPHKQILHVSFLANELKNAGCSQVTAIIPYFGYSRQEKSKIPGKFGNAGIIAKLLQEAGVDNVVTIEAHTPVLNELFTIPFHSLSPLDIITQHIRTHIDLSQGVSLIAVDKGAYERAHTIAQKLGVNAIYFSKQRYDTNKTAIMSMSGELNTPTAIIVDDIIDTGGTALQVCNALVERRGTPCLWLFCTSSTFQ